MLKRNETRNERNRRLTNDHSWHTLVCQLSAHNSTGRRLVLGSLLSETVLGKQGGGEGGEGVLLFCFNFLC